MTKTAASRAFHATLSKLREHHRRQFDAILKIDGREPVGHELMAELFRLDSEGIGLVEELGSAFGEYVFGADSLHEEMERKPAPITAFADADNAFPDTHAVACPDLSRPIVTCGLSGLHVVDCDCERCSVPRVERINPNDGTTIRPIPGAVITRVTTEREIAAAWNPEQARSGSKSAEEEEQDEATVRFIVGEPGWDETRIQPSGPGVLGANGEPASYTPDPTVDDFGAKIVRAYDGIFDDHIDTADATREPFLQAVIDNFGDGDHLESLDEELGREARVAS